MLHFPRNSDEDKFRRTLIQNVAEQAVNLSSTHGVCLSLPLDVPGLYSIHTTCSGKNLFWRFSIHDEITGIP